MVKAYKFFVLEGRRWVTCEKEADALKIRSELLFGAYSPIDGDVIKLRFVDPNYDDGSSAVPEVFGFLHDGMLCNPPAFDILSPIIDCCGAWTKMQLSGSDAWFFSVTTLLDVLDLDRTRFTEFDGQIVNIESVRLIDGDYVDTPIFKLSYIKAFPPIVTERFLAACLANNIRGLEFERISREDSVTQ